MLVKCIANFYPTTFASTMLSIFLALQDNKYFHLKLNIDEKYCHNKSVNLRAIYSLVSGVSIFDM